MILDDLVAATKRRIADQKVLKPLAELQEKTAGLQPNRFFPFERALQRPGLCFICEVKQASPSKGVIAGEFNYLQIARDYEAAGADAISVLTEPQYFHGKLQYLQQIHQTVATPILRKDFVIDPYMIYQARLAGAAAILLITAILTDRQLTDYLQLADNLGLSAVVEVHDEIEAQRALAVGARVIGVNNRNLKDFSVDLTTSIRLRQLVPGTKLFISESGIQTAEDVQALREVYVDAVLIGESMMRASDKTAQLAALRGEERR